MKANTATKGAAARARLELAPALALHGEAAPLLGPLIRLRPELGPALMLAPGRDVHARAAFALAATAWGDGPVALADALLTRRPRDLLAEALGPGGAHPRLHRLLSRGRLPAWPLSSYAALDAALRAGVADALDARAALVGGARVGAAIDAAQVADLSDLVGGGADPALRRARLALPFRHDRAALASALAALRPRGAAAPLEGLPEGAGRRALRRRAEAAVGALRSPHAALRLGGGWEVLETVRALWDVGRDLSLCCARGGWEAAPYAVALASGASLFAFHRGHGVLARCPLALGVVAASEVRGRRNRDAGAAVQEGLRDALRDAGLAVVEVDLGDALRALLAGGEGLDVEDAALGDAEDADVGNGLAAGPDGGAQPAAALAA